MLNAYGITPLINWKRLRSQKLTLIKLVNSNRVTPLEREHLDGILSLLDAVQDYAVDSDGVPSQTVFGRSK